MTARSNYNWDDADAIVIPEQVADATNPRGCIVVRQAGQYGPEEDQWIVLVPQHAPALAQAIHARVRLYS